MSEKKKWLKLSVSLDPVLMDAVTDFMIGILNAGVEVSVEDRIQTRVLHAFMEKENLNKQETQSAIDTVKNHLQELAAIFHVDVPVLEYTEIEEQDWSNNWKTHFAPFSVIPGLVIVPSWEKYVCKEGEKAVEMDPGMAFGTGHHATTSMSLELIRRVVEEHPGGKVLDVGTGTGVLGMAALLFGASQVLGVDNDPEAVTAAMENVIKNRLDDKMSVAITDLSEIEGKYDLVVANIIHDVLQILREDLIGRIQEDGYLVLSGLLHGEQVESIIKTFTCSKKLKVVTSVQKGEWAALLLKRAG